MASRLIYHNQVSSDGGVSPFDRAITKMVTDEVVRIASPYVGFNYLNKIIELADDWWLITDLNEMLRLQPVKHRAEMADFVIRNSDRIRHCPDLHAKVVVAGTRAMAGSANLTNKGITGRIEMSVLFGDCRQVSELQSWFDHLWEQIESVSERSIYEFIEKVPVVAESHESTNFPSIFSGVRSSLDADPDGRLASDGYDLVEHLRIAPSRSWASLWLDMAKQLVEVAELGPDDPRLVMSLPQDRSMAVTINRRYVLNVSQPFDDFRGYPDIGVILPASMRDELDRMPNVIGVFPFRDGHRGETPDTAPLFVTFSNGESFKFKPAILDSWNEAVLTECLHGQKSNNRRHHQPTMYRAVSEVGFRERLLDKAFPT